MADYFDPEVRRYGQWCAVLCSLASWSITSLLRPQVTWSETSFLLKENVIFFSDSLNVLKLYLYIYVMPICVFLCAKCFVFFCLGVGTTMSLTLFAYKGYCGIYCWSQKYFTFRLCLCP